MIVERVTGFPDHLGLDQSCDCLAFPDEHGAKWCLKFEDRQIYAVFKLIAPKILTGYRLVFANDFPERDPVEWIVSCRQPDSGEVHEEVHNGMAMETPSRFGS